MAEYQLDVHTKIALLEKDVEILRVQTNELGELKKDFKDQMLALRYKNEAMETALNNLKERFDEKLDDLYEDQRDLMQQQKVTSEMLAVLNSSITNLTSKIDAATRPDDDPPPKTAISFGEGNWNTLLRIVILIISSIAFLLGVPNPIITGGGG